MSFDCVIKALLPWRLSSQLNTGKDNDGDTGSSTDVPGYICICASVSWNNMSCQSDGTVRQWEGHRGRVGLKMWEGGRGMTASAVSSKHLHMAQCPSSTVLNDKSPASPSSQTETPLQTPLHTHTQTQTPVHTQPCRHTLYIRGQARTKPCTKAGRHTHLLHFA